MERVRHKRLLTWLVLTLLAVVYLVLPVFAGFIELGDRRGPRVYPEPLHDALYRVGWHAASHDGIKPRIAHDAGPRPLFYGLD